MSDRVGREFRKCVVAEYVYPLAFLRSRLAFMTSTYVGPPAPRVNKEKNFEISVDARKNGEKPTRYQPPPPPGTMEDLINSV